MYNACCKGKCFFKNNIQTLGFVFFIFLLLLGGESMIVNGKEMDFQEGITVEQLLNELNLPKEKVVVEVNLNIIDLSTYSSTALNNGDRVEIVRFVGGG